MKYFKTPGCFCLMYLFVYFFISPLLQFAVQDRYLFMIVFYLVLLGLGIGYLKLCREDVKKRLHLKPLRPAAALLSVLLAFTILPFISLINNVSQLIFRDFITSSVSTASQNPLAVYPGAVCTSGDRGGSAVPRRSLFRSSESSSHQRNPADRIVFRHRTHEF